MSEVCILIFPIAAFYRKHNGLRHLVTAGSGQGVNLVGGSLSDMNLAAITTALNVNFTTATQAFMTWERTYHRNNPVSDPWQYKAHKDQHGMSNRKDEDSPCEAENTSDHTSVEANPEAAWDQPLSHTNRCNWKGSSDAKDCNQDNAKHEDRALSCREFSQVAVSLDFPVRHFDPVLVEAHCPGFSVLSLLEFLSASETYRFDGWAVAILEPVGTEEVAVASVLSLDPQPQM
ncbi:hypothetical protein N7499_009466 [Penicillium canescens]|nr:hypothetical protein N7499_009466 [Penicillium canescens]KAJ6170131.1 hypothetical protein N7485_007477 [Penicillium canescens]